jgi:hypothetical protein
LVAEWRTASSSTAADTPAAEDFAATLSRQPPVQQLPATTLWEGTANLAASS